MAARLLQILEQQFFDNSGNPLSGGKVYSYVAGSSTPLVTYTDSTGGTPNANPVILDAYGRASIWIGSALYKFILKDSNDVTIQTQDNVTGNLTTATDGIDGKSLRNGSGAPSNGTGNDGDFYIDNTAHFIYGPKAGGVWPAGVSIVGPIGSILPTVTGTHSAPTLLANAGNITFTAGTQLMKQYISGNAAAVTGITIQAGTVEGQKLILVGCSDSNTVQIDDSANVVSKGLMIMGNNDTATFDWDNTQAKWVLFGRNF